MAFILTACIIAIVALVPVVFVRTAKFGRIATGERLKKIQQSPNYREGKFQNLSVTPDLSDGASYSTVMRDFFFNRSKRSKPIKKIPAKKVNLHTLSKETNCIIWFGHSGYFFQLNGKRILVDPVLSGAASPVAFTTRAFAGADAYAAEDIPAVDYLFLTHDHWDHLDYPTIRKIHSRCSKIITGLGVGAHLERWKIPAGKITEMDWNTYTQPEDTVKIFCTPARHFSGRGLKRAQSIWCSFVLQIDTRKLFIGGDSGYDTHFKKIGEGYGPFDLAILECGQYNKSWKHIHTMPEETVQAAIDLKAKRLFPVHWGKFSLALHDWDDPVHRVVKEAAAKKMPLLLPYIGELVLLDETHATVSWWEDLG